MVTGTMGHELANRGDACRAVLHQDPDLGRAQLQELDDARAAIMLRQSWVFPRGLSTPEMKGGSDNAGPVMNAIRRQNWCSELFEVGLFASKTTPCMAASPDGICKVQLRASSPSSTASSSNSNNNSRLVTAAVEIKTRFAPNMIRKARACVAKYADPHSI